MATATLHGAKTYLYGGLAFAANKPVVVPDEVAEALAALPQYFTVAFDRRRTGARQVPRPEALAGPADPAEPAESF